MWKIIDLDRINLVKYLQNDIRVRFGDEVLHLLNGQTMFDDYQENRLTVHGYYAPFNEAMCAHETSEEIFGAEFNALRALGHGVSAADYERITLRPLQPLLEGRSFDGIVLWFGDDMFCQMNLLTVLAYLQRAGYRGKVVFHRVIETAEAIETIDAMQAMEPIELPALDYAALYKQVLVRRERPVPPPFPIMARGIDLYLEYRKPGGEIAAFIRQHADKADDELLQDLFRRFSHYGLGDTQYREMIRAVRG